MHDKERDDVAGRSFITALKFNVVENLHLHFDVHAGVPAMTVEQWLDHGIEELGKLKDKIMSKMDEAEAAMERAVTQGEGLRIKYRALLDQIKDLGITDARLDAIIAKANDEADKDMALINANTPAAHIDPTASGDGSGDGSGADAGTQQGGDGGDNG